MSNCARCGMRLFEGEQMRLDLSKDAWASSRVRTLCGQCGNLLLKWLDVGPWCHEDSCPASICNGPHSVHVCMPGNDDIIYKVGEEQPCPQCGEKLG